MHTRTTFVRNDQEWLSAVLMVAGAAMLQSCVLAAMAGVFAVGGFYDRMDRESHQRPLQCAIRCVLGGLLALVAALILGAILTTHFGGYWNPSAQTAIPALIIVVLSIGIWFARRVPGIALRPWPALVPWAALAGLIALLVSHALQAPFAQCVFAEVVTAVLAWSAWRLIWIVAPSIILGAGR